MCEEKKMDLLRMKSRFCLSLVAALLCFTFILGNAKSSCAYYGGSMYGGLYGMGLGGSYGGLGLYGMGGLGSLYGMGGMMGGLYGMSGMMGGLYGMSSLYGMGGMMGGLYGMSSLYGMGGMMGGLYGMGGMMGGLYGMSGLYGMGGMMGGLYGMGGMMGGLSGMSGLLGSLSSLGGLTGSLSPAISTPATTAAPVAAEQAGYWSGYYLSLLKLKGGLMTLNLVEDPITLDLSGPVLLALNQFKIPPVIVAGPNFGTGSFTLTGTYYDVINLITYALQFNCVMTSDTTMTGDYLIADQLYTKLDYGTFNLTLGATTLIPTLLPTTSLLPII